MKPDKKAKHRFVKEEAIKMIEEIYEVFEKNNIPIWLHGGTLLGAIRDKKFIPWDDDIDFKVWKKDIENEKIRKKITAELMAKGYTLYFLWHTINMEKNKIKVNISFTTAENGIVIMKDSCRDKKADYFFYKIKQLNSIKYYGKFILTSTNGFRDLIKINFLKINNYIPPKFKKAIYKIFKFILSPFRREKLYRLSFPESYFKKLKKIKFYHLKINVPVESKKFLRELYGDDWNIPPKNPENWGNYLDHGKWKMEKPKNIKHNRYGW